MSSPPVTELLHPQSTLDGDVHEGWPRSRLYEGFPGVHTDAADVLERLAAVDGSDLIELVAWPIARAAT